MKLKFFLLSILLMCASCDENTFTDHTAHTDTNYQLSTKDRCFLELAKLTIYSETKACTEAGIFPTKVTHNNFIMSTPKGPSGVYFVSGSLHIECSSCQNLPEAAFFGPGSVSLNGEPCPKKNNQFQCRINPINSAHKVDEEPPARERRSSSNKAPSNVEASQLVGTWKQECTPWHESLHLTRKESLSITSMKAEAKFAQSYWSGDTVEYEITRYENSNCTGNFAKYSFTGKYQIENHNLLVINLNREVFVKTIWKNYDGTANHLRTPLKILELNRNSLILDFSNSESLPNIQEAVFRK